MAVHVSGRSSSHHQEHKTIHTASGVVKPVLLLAATVDEMELCSISSTNGVPSHPRTEFHLIHERSSISSTNGVPSHPRKRQYWFDNTWRCMYSFVLLVMSGGTAW